MIDFCSDTIRSLVGEFGSPLYVFDECGFAANYSELFDAMSELYSNYRVSYSFKTNYTPYICDVVKRLGGYAEVVSDLEYHIAKRIGFSFEKIIFNGPNKGKAGIDALLQGCIVNVDNLSELSTMLDVAKAHQGRTLKLGLRVNVDISDAFVSRFGMDFDDLLRAKRHVEDAPNVTIAGLHCHISRCRGLDAWRKRSETLLETAKNLGLDDLEYYDLGSGMYGKMPQVLYRQFDSVPTYKEYAQVTAGIFSRHFEDRPRDDRPLLLTEPGTTLVSKYVYCIGRVDSIKTIGNRAFAVMDCSFHNLGEVCTLKSIPCTIVPSEGRREQFPEVALVGYTCLEQDMMCNLRDCELAEGDYVVFENVGGYSTVLKPPFIKPNCAMVARDCNGLFRLIKRAETNEDLLGTYIWSGVVR